MQLERHRKAWRKLDSEKRQLEFASCETPVESEMDSARVLPLRKRAFAEFRLGFVFLKEIVKDAAPPLVARAADHFEVLIRFFAVYFCGFMRRHSVMLDRCRFQNPGHVRIPF
jgi:hypothetical protein